MIIERATKLRMARTATGQSAAQVARALGIMPAAYRAYERRENRQPIDAVEKIAKLFGKTISEVFGDDTPEISPPLPALAPGGRDLPVLGSARGGSDGFDLAVGAAAMSYTDRPANLNGVSAALTQSSSTARPWSRAITPARYCTSTRNVAANYRLGTVAGNGYTRMPCFGTGL